MPSIDDLLEALERAAKANQRDEFDSHEAELFSRVGGFANMPRDIKDRYVEVDRAWPASLSREEEPSNYISRLPLHTRVPDELISWLQEFGAHTGRNRSDVLTACLEAVRDDESLLESIAKKLRDPTPSSDE